VDSVSIETMVPVARPRQRVRWKDVLKQAQDQHRAHAEENASRDKGKRRSVHRLSASFE
jgi:hypothetical protein